MTPSIVAEAVPCPTCGQGTGQPCAGIDHAPRPPHSRRLLRASALDAATLRSMARRNRQLARRVESATTRAALREASRKLDAAADSLTQPFQET